MIMQGLPPPHQNTRQQHPHPDEVDPLNNLMSLLFGSGFSPGNTGDFIHTQEDFDRVISDIMEQHQMSHAAPPAPEPEIASLPKVPVTQAMLGENGKADCSICMDEVEKDQQVTKLYCDHWFHPECISMWLKEHDTCPHCRKSIDDGKKMAEERSARIPATPAAVPRSAGVQSPAAGASSSPAREPTIRRGSSHLGRHRDRSGHTDNNNHNNNGGVMANLRRLSTNFFHNNTNDDNNNGGDRRESR
jgi:E3 ubiquitin-protein ligase RNF115/126